MPVIKSAKKALTVAKRRKVENDNIRKSIREAVKKFRSQPTETNLKQVYSAVDKAAKKYIFHKNKAARLKSKFIEMVTSKSPKKSSKTSRATL